HAHREDHAARYFRANEVQRLDAGGALLRWHVGDEDADRPAAPAACHHEPCAIGAEAPAGRTRRPATELGWVLRERGEQVETGPVIGARGHASPYHPRRVVAHRHE